VDEPPPVPLHLCAVELTLEHPVLGTPLRVIVDPPACFGVPSAALTPSLAVAPSATC
jgi:hypothetical protein